MGSLPQYLNWQTRQDEDHILWLGLDRKNVTANSLNVEVLEELKQILTEIQKGTLPKGLVIYSAKPSGFIAGADILQFKSLDNEDAAFELIRQGQIIFQQLADLPIPTVAWIHGFCLGGGLELALACKYRIAEDDAKTKLGLPEVMLGIHPGWGGTIRLPRMIGALKALDLILSGRQVSSKVAKKMGFVDQVVPKRHALTAVRHFIKTAPTVRQATILEAFTNSDRVRPLLGKYLHKKLTEKVNRIHYPAPFAALDLWIEQGVNNDAAFVAEAKSIGQLLVTDTARNLVRVFGLQDKLKGLARHAGQRPVHVHVVGAGVMGGDIAAVCALKGIRVSLQDQNHSAIAQSFKRAAILFKKVLKEPHLVRAAQDRLIPDIQGAGIRHADIILEAIVEKKEAKQALFKSVELEAKKEAIFATNTSTIPLEEIGSVLRSPERLVGIHFFNPVSKMPLVEVVKSKETSEATFTKAMAFVKAIDKLPLPVKSAAGFLVNRILTPYLLESMLLLEEGIPAQAIDKAATDFGMPMGPIELADTVGLDVCLYGAESLKIYFAGQQIPAKMKELVKAGNFGKKTGRGFYQYKNDKMIKEPIDPNYRPPVDIIDRLVLRMVNESVACLREGIVEDADSLDAGMIFGAGFPPFRGGPLHYAKEQGEELLLQRLNLLVQRYGDRFLADSGWDILAAA